MQKLTKTRNVTIAVLLSTLMAVLASGLLAIGYVSVGVAPYSGWASGVGHESAYVTWTSSGTGYSAHVRQGDEGAWSAVDAPLVRTVDEDQESWRVDVLGLRAGTQYQIQIRNGEDVSHTTGNLTPTAFDRQGYAFATNHVNGVQRATGGYNEYGQVGDAEIIYVTHQTMLDGVLDRFGQDPMAHNQRPIIVRFIGQVGIFNEGGMGIQLPSNLSRPARSLVVAGPVGAATASNAVGNMTFEGVGPGAAIVGWGLRFERVRNIVVRNLHFRAWETAEYALTFAGHGANAGVGFLQHSHMWVVNNSFDSRNRPPSGGDGVINISNGWTHYSIAYNTFVGGARSLALISGGDTAFVGHGTIHHNSITNGGGRNPRVRHSFLHMFNNVFDGLSSYGVGAGTRANIVAEGNHFTNVARPYIQQGSPSNQGSLADATPGIILTSLAPAAVQTANVGSRPLVADAGINEAWAHRAEFALEGAFADRVTSENRIAVTGGGFSYTFVPFDNEYAWPNSDQHGGNVPSPDGWQALATINDTLSDIGVQSADAARTRVDSHAGAPGEIGDVYTGMSTDDNMNIDLWPGRPEAPISALETVEGREYVRTVLLDEELISARGDDLGWNANAGQTLVSLPENTLFEIDSEDDLQEALPDREHWGYFGVRTPASNPPVSFVRVQDFYWRGHNGTLGALPQLRTHSAIDLGTSAYAGAVNAANFATSTHSSRYLRMEIPSGHRADVVVHAGALTAGNRFLHLRNSDNSDVRIYRVNSGSTEIPTMNANGVEVDVQPTRQVTQRTFENLSSGVWTLGSRDNNALLIFRVEIRLFLQQDITDSYVLDGDELFYDGDVSNEFVVGQNRTFGQGGFFTVVTPTATNVSLPTLSGVGRVMDGRPHNDAVSGISRNYGRLQMQASSQFVSGELSSNYIRFDVPSMGDYSANVTIWAVAGQTTIPVRLSQSRAYTQPDARQMIAGRGTTGSDFVSRTTFANIEAGTWFITNHGGGVSILRVQVDIINKATETTVDNPLNRLIFEGSSRQLLVPALADNEGATVEWRSSDESIATVADGLVTAVSRGEVRITVYVTTADGTTLYRGEVTLTVLQRWWLS